MVHESEQTDFGDGEQPESVSDNLVSDQIIRFLNKAAEPLPADGKLLGLAAGQAFAETRLAATLGITNVTLVDKIFSRAARSGIQQALPTARIIDSDMFHFLETTPETDFSLITALGIEYALTDPDAMERFISLLPRVTRAGGIVVVSPFVGKQDPSQHWQSKGFEPVFPATTFRGPNVSGMMMYRFRGNTQAGGR